MIRARAWPRGVTRKRHPLGSSVASIGQILGCVSMRALYRKGRARHEDRTGHHRSSPDPRARGRRYCSRARRGWRSGRIRGSVRVRCKTFCSTPMCSAGPNRDLGIRCTGEVAHFGTHIFRIHRVQVDYGGCIDVRFDPGGSNARTRRDFRDYSQAMASRVS